MTKQDERSHLKFPLDLGVHNRGGERVDTDNNNNNNIINPPPSPSLPPSFLPSRRRLLTQLEAAKSSRVSSAGGSKPTAAKGPDGVVLYELHSRPEQDKFNESAKVEWRGNVGAAYISE